MQHFQRGERKKKLFSLLRPELTSYGRDGPLGKLHTALLEPSAARAASPCREAPSATCPLPPRLRHTASPPGSRRGRQEPGGREQRASPSPSGGCRPRLGPPTRPASLGCTERRPGTGAQRPPVQKPVSPPSARLKTKGIDSFSGKRLGNPDSPPQPPDTLAQHPGGTLPAPQADSKARRPPLLSGATGRGCDPQDRRVRDANKDKN